MIDSDTTKLPSTHDRTILTNDDSQTTQWRLAHAKRKGQKSLLTVKQNGRHAGAWKHEHIQRSALDGIAPGEEHSCSASKDRAPALTSACILDS